jgi:hypothetical protein
MFKFPVLPDGFRASLLALPCGLGHPLDVAVLLDHPSMETLEAQSYRFVEERGRSADNLTLRTDLHSPQNSMQANLIKSHVIS